MRIYVSPRSLPSLKVCANGQIFAIMTFPDTVVHRTRGIFLFYVFSRGISSAAYQTVALSPLAFAIARPRYLHREKIGKLVTSCER